VSSNAGSGATFLSGDTAGGIALPSGSVVVVPHGGGGPENIEVIDEEAELEKRGRPRKRMFRRLSKKKRPPKAPGLPSTSELMQGMAPSPSVADHDTIRERIRETMSVPPHSASPAASVISAPAVETYARPSMESPSAMNEGQGGTWSSLGRSPGHPPTPPLSRQTPHLTQMTFGSSASLAPSKARSASTRRISVREVTQGAPTDGDAHSVAAMSYASRPPKVARIFDIAEVIPSSRPLSAVTEESVNGGTPRTSPYAGTRIAQGTVDAGNFAAIEQWANKHRGRLDSIDTRLQALKAEVLQQKLPRRYYPMLG